MRMLHSTSSLWPSSRVELWTGAAMTSEVFEAISVDYLSQLPHELIEEILYLLRPKDALSLLQANRRLHEVIGSCDSYWRMACVDGMMIASQATLEHHLKSVGSPKELHVQKSRHFDRTFFRSLKAATLPRKYPARGSKGCRFARNDLIVEVVPAGTPSKDSADQDLKVIVAKLDHETGTFNQLYSCDFSGCHDIVTAYLASNSKHLLFASECGHWVCCDYSSKTELYRWKGNNHSDSICIGCCRSCFLVVSPDIGFSCQYGTCDYYWQFDILKLGKRKGVQQTINIKFPAEHIHEAFVPFSLLTQKIYVVPDSDDTDSKGFCRSHRIILQCGSMIVIYKFELPATLVTKPEKILCTICDDPDTLMEAPCPLDLEFPTNLMILSADYRQLGVIYDFLLHIWDLRTFEKHCVEVDLWSPMCELLVVGRVFSILGSAEGRGQLQVICTETGDEVNATSSFAKKHQHGKGRRKKTPGERGNNCDIIFQGMADEGWVNSYDCVCATDRPFIIYWNNRGKTLEGLSFVATSSGHKYLCGCGSFHACP